MLGETPLQQLLPARARACLNRIQNQIWHGYDDILVDWAGSTKEHVSIAEARKRRLSPVKEAFFTGLDFGQTDTIKASLNGVASSDKVDLDSGILFGGAGQLQQAFSEQLCRKGS